MPKKSDFDEACREVIQAAKDYPGNSYLQYAAEYAQAGLRIESWEDIKTQSLYILNNLRYWRGILATDVKRKLGEVAND